MDAREIKKLAPNELAAFAAGFCPECAQFIRGWDGLGLTPEVAESIQGHDVELETGHKDGCSKRWLVI